MSWQLTFRRSLAPSRAALNPDQGLSELGSSTCITCSFDSTAEPLASTKSLKPQLTQRLLTQRLCAPIRVSCTLIRSSARQLGQTAPAIKRPLTLLSGVSLSIARIPMQTVGPALRSVHGYRGGSHATKKRPQLPVLSTCQNHRSPQLRRPAPPRHKMPFVGCCWRWR